MPNGLGSWGWWSGFYPYPYWWMRCRWFPWLPRWWWLGFFAPFWRYGDLFLPYSKEEEIAMLEEEAKLLEQEMALVKKRLDELKKGAKE